MNNFKSSFENSSWTPSGILLGVSSISIGILPATLLKISPWIPLGIYLGVLLTMVSKALKEILEGAQSQIQLRVPFEFPPQVPSQISARIISSILLENSLRVLSRTFKWISSKSFFFEKLHNALYR